VPELETFAEFPETKLEVAETFAEFSATETEFLARITGIQTAKSTRKRTVFH